MTLSEILESMRLKDGSAEVVIGEDWLQGRSVFGGLQAAIALCAMRTVVPASVPLRTLQMTFIAPVPAGVVHATARILRAGKSATHVEALLQDAGQVVAMVIGVFGTARQSLVLLQPASSAPSVGVKTVSLPSTQDSSMPSFMQHFDVELLEGALPFSGTPVPRNVFQLGMRDSGMTTESHLLAIADFVPPVALSWLSHVAPGSSLTWMIELLTEDFAGQPLSGWRVETDMVAARDGYTSQSTLVRAPDGSPMALSRQAMVVFA